MVDYIHSSQNNEWHFHTKQELDICRSYTNYRARQFLYQRDLSSNNGSGKGSGDGNEIDTTTTTTTTVVAAAAEQQDEEWSTTTTTFIKSLPVSCYACNISERKRIIDNNASTIQYSTTGPWYSPNDSKQKQKYISYEQEVIVIQFYGQKIPNIIGPNAEIKRLRRESKVVATAATLYNRFFISNSILLYDPKIIMVAATFLACKVEDVTTDIRYIEQATQILNAHVTISDIVMGEIFLLSGIHYNLVCFHPYKSVLAITEDLRTFLKTNVGQTAFTITTPDTNTSNNSDDPTTTTTTTTNTTTIQVLSGQDLKPIYDIARTILDLIIISDIPLLYSPGQIGMATLTVAHNEIMLQQQQQNNNKLLNTDHYKDILCRVYIPARFANTTLPITKTKTSSSSSSLSDNNNNALEVLPTIITNIANMIRTLKEQNRQMTNNIEQYMSDLKSIHKQLKKVRIWGITSTSNTNNSSDNKNSNGEKKKSKKRTLPNETSDTTTTDPTHHDDDNTEQPSKRIRTE